MAQPASSNFFLDNDDLRFQMSRFDWSTLVDLQEQLFLHQPHRLGIIVPEESDQRIGTGGHGGMVR